MESSRFVHSHEQFMVVSPEQYVLVTRLSLRIYEGISLGVGTGFFVVGVAYW
jgi:hypothetical protein